MCFYAYNFWCVCFLIVKTENAQKALSKVMLWYIVFVRNLQWQMLENATSFLEFYDI